MTINHHIEELVDNGYSIINDVYAANEIASMLMTLEHYKHHNRDLVHKDVFAIRQLMKVVPKLKPSIFNEQLLAILNEVLESGYFLSKAIYFDKPPKSNWFVPFHQDLSISVNQKANLKGYDNWTFKKGQHGVQPPQTILEHTLTVRIHLDDTTKDNGALRIIPKSHKKGIVRAHQLKMSDRRRETICKVHSGGIMLMKPLLFHASDRTKNNQRRRIIHLEFNNRLLQAPLQWLEHETIN